MYLLKFMRKVTVMYWQSEENEMEELTRKRSKTKTIIKELTALYTGKVHKICPRTESVG